MILTIDTTERTKIILGLFDGKNYRCFQFETERQSEDLLLTIDGILKKEKISFKDLKAVAINCGPGSFTGTRVGVTTANALAWSLDIPVLGYQEDFEGVLNEAVRNKGFERSAKPIYR
jgi:tRNA threonylcarbamoyladenosine biosynthesis protein TsaB